MSASRLEKRLEALSAAARQRSAERGEGDRSVQQNAPVSINKSQQLLIDTAEEIWGADAVDANQLGFLNALHANCYLPRRKTTATEYEHRNGNLHIVMEAGKLKNPNTGEREQMPLPFGGKPRALLTYLNTYAVKHRTAEVYVGDSFTDFVKRMSRTNSVSGGERGSLTLWKRQLNCLAAARTQISWTDGEALSTDQMHFARRIKIYMSRDPNEKSFFPTYLELSTDYYEHILEHAMPVDLRAVGQLTDRPLAYDIYLWATYRLCRVKNRKGEFISWDSMKAQFGPDYKNMKHFKEPFKDALKLVKMLYRDAKINEVKGGFMIHRSKRAVPGKISVLLPGK